MEVKTIRKTAHSETNVVENPSDGLLNLCRTLRKNKMDRKEKTIREGKNVKNRILI